MLVCSLKIIVNFLELEQFKSRAANDVVLSSAKTSFKAFTQKVKDTGTDKFFKVKDYRFQVFNKLTEFFIALDKIVSYGSNSLLKEVFLKDWKAGDEKPLLVDHLMFSAAKSIYEAKVLMNMGAPRDANSDNAKLESSLRGFNKFAEEELYPRLDTIQRDELDGLETIAIAETLDRRKAGQGEVFLNHYASLSQSVNIE